MKVSARGRVWVAAVALVVIAAGVAVLVRARRRFPSQPANTEWRPRAVSIPDGGCVAKAEPPPAPGAPTRFAVIGDFGYAGPDEEAVADLVKAWRPDKPRLSD